MKQPPGLKALDLYARPFSAGLKTRFPGLKSGAGTVGLERINGLPL
jgi:hypothetical protein